MARAKKNEGAEAALPLVDAPTACDTQTEGEAVVETLLVDAPSEIPGTDIRDDGTVEREIAAATWDGNTLFQIICDVVEPWHEDLGWSYSTHAEYAAALPLLLEKAVQMNLDVRPLQEALAAEVAGLEAQASHYNEVANTFAGKAAKREEVLSKLDAALLGLVLRQGMEFGKAGNKRLTLGDTTYKSASSQRLLVDHRRRDQIELEQPLWLEEPKEPQISTSKVKAALKTMSEDEQRETLSRYGMKVTTTWRLDYK